MRLNKLGLLTAISAVCATVAGCSNTPASGPQASTQAHITGTALFRERLALPPNAVFEALLEDVSRADARAVVLGQQNISPAGSPPYILNIPYNPSQIVPGGRYNVRTSIRVNDKLWFINDQAAPVLQQASQTQVDVLMRRISEQEQPPAPQAMPKPGSQASPKGALVPAALLNHTWQVSHLGNQALDKGALPTLRFETTEAKVVGHTSCNNFSADYNAQGHQLQFGPMGMTKMLCQNSHERAFVDAMKRVRGLHQSGRILHLQDAAGTTVLTATRP